MLYPAFGYNNKTIETTKLLNPILKITLCERYNVTQVWHFQEEINDSISFLLQRPQVIYTSFFTCKIHVFIPSIQTRQFNLSF